MTIGSGAAAACAAASSSKRRTASSQPGYISFSALVSASSAGRMARILGLEHTNARLTADPAYNVQVGSEYLRQMVDEFGPSVALIASGYNAGPGRPRKWMAEFGDPRMPQVDVVDWVETIPFAETRTYVMRVAEGVVIYRQRLKGVASPVRITAELKGG